MITLDEAAQLLLKKDDILILTHRFPDGDTLGSGYGLCLALQSKGKNAMVSCSDPIPEKYGYFTSKPKRQEFEPKFIVSTDIADTQLLGDKLSVYSDRIDLCIDHHGSNTHFAKKWYVDAGAAATTQIIAKIIKLMNAEITPDIANCIYTGLSTDTGCFRYTNATAETYRTAADMIEHGADAAAINRIMFDTKSRARLEIERRVLDSMEFFANGKCAVAYATLKMISDSKARDSDMEGIAAMARQVEGVMVGVTVREQPDNKYKISLRTVDGLDASKICAYFGGGGHKAAAGCTLSGTLDEVKKKIVGVVCRAIEEQA